MRPLASSAYQSVCAFRSALPSASKYDRTTVLVSVAGAVASPVVMIRPPARGHPRPYAPQPRRSSPAPDESRSRDYFRSNAVAVSLLTSAQSARSFGATLAPSSSSVSQLLQPPTTATATLAPSTS